MSKPLIHIAILAAIGSAPVSVLAAPAATDTERAAAAEEQKRLGSLYVRCDGEPNNMTGAESFARIMGAVTLLGLFAPSPEAADPAKRLFAEKGVDACTQLLDNPKQETNGMRRIPLILARALHQIEARNHQAALADVEKARGEATALGLTQNSYFAHTMGLSFNVIAAEAKLRMGDGGGARQAGLTDQARMPYSHYATIAARPFAANNRDLSAEEERYWQTGQKIAPGMLFGHAVRLEEVGRFAEAAELREALITLLGAIDTSGKDSSAMAQAAITHALAGHWDKAAGRADEARSNMTALADSGKPENDQPSVIELLDFHQLLQLMRDGKIDEARRNFAARSQWSAPGLGAVMAVNTQLRQGAKPEQIFGALAKMPDQLWEERRSQLLAQRLEWDKNNRTLFTYILPYARISSFENLSKDIWRTDKPRLITKEPMKDSKFYFAFVNADAMTQPDALMLTAAVQAKAKGFPGFVYIGFPKEPSRAMIQFGKPDDPDIAKPLYLDADAVIAELSQLIPSPAELDARRKAKR